MDQKKLMKLMKRMKLNPWEQRDIEAFNQRAEEMVDEDGMEDYRKILLAKAEILLELSRNKKKNYRRWTSDALGMGKNHLHRHKI